MTNMPRGEIYAEPPRLMFSRNKDQSNSTTSGFELGAAYIDPNNQRIQEKIEATLQVLTFLEHQLLTTIDQPFGVGVLDAEGRSFVVDKDQEEEDCSALARAYRRRLAEWTPDVTNYMPKHFPVFDLNTPLCVEGLELLTSSKYTSYAYEVQQIHKALETVNLSTPQAYGYPTSNVTTAECVDRTFRNFNSGKESLLLQFWAYVLNNSEDMGCILMLTDQTLMSTRDEGLEEYRRRCLENRCRFVGLATSVGNWLAGRAAQTGIADHRTKQHVTNQQDQHSADIGGMGQLVLPVFYGQGAGNKLVGIIELVTSVPKESYVEDFEQVQKLLKTQQEAKETDEGLKSSYMGKTIKFKYNDDLIKFTLRLSAEFADLHREVKTRFPELEHKFRVEYHDTEVKFDFN
ncbi:hypothetical protein M8C21_018913 [Ambrosia artemisiifolia]|uniref:GAF domain-containing protein n=1 Tax=Ambrosia artemisiifolia TaxID=4212 RepID=A0AAD5DAZ2_AMBAR|nr:hypothetical protein M8C21_018913 [Ambrosia artemisiifolia]